MDEKDVKKFGIGHLKNKLKDLRRGIMGEIELSLSGGRLVSDSSKKDREDVTVIIGVRNRFDYRLRNAFKSIRNQDYDQSLIKIILVDYGSEENYIKGFQDLCQEFCVEYIRVEDIKVWNRSHALNIGIKKCNTKYVLCSDVDDIFEKNYISECIKEIQRDFEQIIFSTMFMLAEEDVLENTDTVSSYSLLKKKSLPRAEVENCYSCTYGLSINLTLTRFYFDIKGYDEYYTAWGNEDDDIIKRFKKFGLKITNIDGKTSYLHQWHPMYEGLSEKDKNQIKNNREYYARMNTIKRNPEGWGEFNKICQNES